MLNLSEPKAPFCDDEAGESGRRIRYRASMLRFMRSVLEELGPRPSGGLSERRLAQRLHHDFSRLCSSSKLEAFTCHPTAFLGSFRLGVGCVSLALLLYVTKHPALGFAVALLGCSMPAFELILYREYVDRLFPRRNSQNVVGRIAPRGELLRRIYVSAHLDSAQEFTLWRIFGPKATWVMALGVLGGVALLLATALAALLPSAVFQRAQLGWVCGVSLATLLPFTLSYWFFYDSQRVVPGAMDNLAGIAVIRELAKLHGATRHATRRLEHTELVLLATGCEEAGLRGAKRFTAEHRSELSEVPSFGIFLDGICTAEHLGVVTHETFLGTKYDETLIHEALNIAGVQQFPITKVTIPVGATDGSAFHAVGIPSIAILAVDCGTLVDNYHTRKDTLERVESDALERALLLTDELVSWLDQQAGGHAVPLQSEHRGLKLVGSGDEQERAAGIRGVRDAAHGSRRRERRAHLGNHVDHNIEQLTQI